MKTASRMEMLGRVSSMSYSVDTDACLVTTVLNGAHVFQLDQNFYGPYLSTGLSASNVESYSTQTLGDEASVLSSCFIGGGKGFALGSASGVVSVVSRCSRGITSTYTTSEGLPIRSLSTVVGQTSSLLISTSTGAEVVDVERTSLLAKLRVPASRTVASVSLSSSTFAVANYDGKVLLYDTRYGYDAATVLSVPDQITSLAVCHETLHVCVGTVAGRVFTLRCIESDACEQAFATGKRRSPVASISMYRNKIAAADISGRLTLIDASDVPDPTVYWSAETLLSGTAQKQVQDEGDDVWQNAEATATTLSHGIVWVSFTSSLSTSPTSQVVALPA